VTQAVREGHQALHLIRNHISLRRQIDTILNNIGDLAVIGTPLCVVAAPPVGFPFYATRARRQPCERLAQRRFSMPLDEPLAGTRRFDSREGLQMSIGQNQNAKLSRAVMGLGYLNRTRRSFGMKGQTVYIAWLITTRTRYSLVPESLTQAQKREVIPQCTTGMDDDGLHGLQPLPMIKPLSRGALRH